MAPRKQRPPGDKVPLQLTAAEKQLVLEDLTCPDPEVEQVLQHTPDSKPVLLGMEDLVDLGGYVAAEASHCHDGKKQKILDTLVEKIQRTMNNHTDEERPSAPSIRMANKNERLADEAVEVARLAAQALVAATELRIKTKPLENFWLEPGQRDVVSKLPHVSQTIKNKLAKGRPLTVAEVATLTMAVAADLTEGDPQRHLLSLAKHLVDRLCEEMVARADRLDKKRSKRKRKPKSDVVYQFKITLLESEPPIWRRIQIQDGTLDQLHEHIQTAMGWTNSHLHQFDIKGERYGDSALLDDGFEDFAWIDSTVTLVSDLLPESGKRFAFTYEYDFGDGWCHEILYEGSPPTERGTQYPRCLEGERACPPEDVGGVWGYAEYLAALADPEHERHEEFMEWSGPFNPAVFDPKKATREMNEGLPNWRTR